MITSVDKEKTPNLTEDPDCTGLLVTDNTGSITDNILSDSGYATSDSEDNNIINTEDSTRYNRQERTASRFVF